jgi:hypothetical protein
LLRNLKKYLVRCKVFIGKQTIDQNFTIMQFMKTTVRLFTTTLLLLQLGIAASAQVALRPIAEHFTNTKCSICASKNPALYANLAANPSVLHLSIHPSSPYPTCILNQQNKADNDARTNFYGIYGSTPKLLLNGSLHPGSNFGSPSLFEPLLNQTTPFDIGIAQQKSANGNYETRVVVKAVAQHSLQQALLFVGLAEDTVFVNGGNGEPTHPNVLRRALTVPGGMTIDLPTSPGDSTVFEFSGTADMVWDFDRIYSIAILQTTTDKAVLQSGRTDTSSSSDPVSADDEAMHLPIFRLFPNPAHDRLTIENSGTTPFDLAIYSNDGKLVLQRKQNDAQAMISVASLRNGFYFVTLTSGKLSSIQSLVIQH